MLDHMQAQVHRLIAARKYAESGSGRAIRRGQRLSMATVASAIEVAETTIWRWETGRHTPKGAAAIRWADLLSDLERTV
jgi:DNA-binding transcriptional regulator YiaG